MARVALGQAHRLYNSSEAMVAAFAQANIPYAAQALLLLQIAELLVARTLFYLIASPTKTR